METITICFTHDDAVALFRGENGSNFGGAETQIYLIAETIAAMPGFEVLFVTYREIPEVEHPGIRFVRRRGPIRRGVPYLSRLVNRHREVAPFRGVDHLILFQTIAGPNTILTSRLSRKLGCRFITRMSCDADIDGRLIPETMRDEYFSALGEAGGIIAQTVRQQARLEDIGLRSTIVPNLVEIPEQGPFIGGNYVLWVGRAAALKRPWLFIEVARALPQYEFIMIASPCDAFLLGSLECDAEDIPNLRIIPGVPYFEIQEYFRDAAILVGTSTVEGFPNVYLQAAVQGTPVVSLKVPTSIYSDLGGCGICAEGDFEHFKSLIGGLMSDPERLGRLGSQAYAYAEQNHGVEAVRPILIDFLRQASSLDNAE